MLKLTINYLSGGCRRNKHISEKRMKIPFYNSGKTQFTFEDYDYQYKNMTC